MNSSDDKPVTTHQCVYKVQCSDLLLSGKEIEATPRLAFCRGRLEITDDGMVHVLGEFIQEGRVCLAAAPFVLTTAWLIWDNVPSVWKWLYLPAACFWLILFTFVFNEYKHYTIDPHRTRAFYNDRERTLFLELPSGKWLAVAPRGRVRDAFLEVMKELYGHRMLESMEKE